MKNNKIIYFGTPELSAIVLEDLHKSGMNIVAVVSQPDRTKGRNRKKLLPTPVKIVAEKLGIKVLQPVSCKDDEFLSELEKLDAACFLVFAFGQILPQKILDMPAIGCFNAHASLLPKLRGAAPINWCIVNGDKETGMSIQKMVFKLDAGAVCWQKKIGITDTDTAHTLANKLIPLATSGLMEVCKQAFSGTLSMNEQDETKASYAPLMKKQDGYLDWNMRAIEISRMVRGFVPWPATTTKLNGKLLKIFDVEILDLPIPYDTKPGDIISSTQAGIRVMCGDCSLMIKELQVEGKKKMEACRFICGCPIPENCKLENIKK